MSLTLTKGRNWQRIKSRSWMRFTRMTILIRRETMFSMCMQSKMLMVRLHRTLKSLSVHTFHRTIPLTKAATLAVKLKTVKVSLRRDLIQRLAQEATRTTLRDPSTTQMKRKSLEQHMRSITNCIKINLMLNFYFLSMFYLYLHLKFVVPTSSAFSNLSTCNYIQNIGS